ncbi:MAG: membrane protein insertion efficiency factor YidD [Pseudonocardia sp.]|nr:membrane protein insertion efficiency factor YidD [Pseudonocardia sp.]
MIGAVRFYQHWISPGLPPTCRFYPSCSAYAAEAVQVHGALRGTGMAVLRLLRCGPWHPGGVDPVPERRTRTRPGAAGAAASGVSAPAHHEPHDCARNCEEQAPC